MPAYTYKARDTVGKLIKGTMDAASKEELIGKLRKTGFMATQVTEAMAIVRLEPAFARLKGISAEDMILFNTQLANMINAGISIVVSLDTLREQIENKKLKNAVGEVYRSIEAGNSFSQALSGRPRIFSGLLVSMVKAGEASGKLDNVLVRFAEFAERQADLKQKIQGALFYPIILLTAGIAVTLFIVTFIIPQFAEIYMKVGITLPLPTLILYKIGIGIKQFWYSIVLFAVLIIMGIKYYTNTEKGRLNYDRFRLKAPVLGALFRKAAISRFARTLGALVASGVPILQSLDIVREVSGNEVISRAVGSARSAVERGEKIAEPLKISGEFPPDAVQMISVGEETGNLDGMLNKISDFYDMSLGYTIKKLTTLIEPLFLVIMGTMVGVIMASMLLPIFDMIKVLRH